NTVCKVLTFLKAGSAEVCFTVESRAAEIRALYKTSVSECCFTVEGRAGKVGLGKVNPCKVDIIGKPDALKIETSSFTLDFSTKSVVERLALICAWQMKYAIPVAFVVPVEVLSNAC